jgi:predicted RNase H-like nuclease (RuvC/YqgF family)
MLLTPTADLILENAELQHEIANLQAQVEELETENMQLGYGVEAYRNDNERLEDQVAELRSVLEQRKPELGNLGYDLQEMGRMVDSNTLIGFVKAIEKALGWEAK